MGEILITGGGGFFGIHLVHGLLGKHYNITVLDQEDFNDSGLGEKIKFIKGDIRDKETVKKACKGIDCIFHNAAVLPVSRSKNEIYKQINIDGTRNILDASLYNGIKKFIFISSSAVYGIPDKLPITEKTELNPICSYGHSKAQAEKICSEYRSSGLDVTILRPRTIIGKGRLGIFQILYSWIADNKNVYIIGKGHNLFQFLSASDLTKACILSIEKYCKNEDFNLGTDRFGSVRKDLQELINYTKSHSRIISLDPISAKAILRLLDTLNLSPLTPWHYMTSDKPFYFDISKAKNILSWQPEMSNFDMLKENYDWYLLNRKTADYEFGFTHKKSVRQRIFRLLKWLS